MRRRTCYSFAITKFSRRPSCVVVCLCRYRPSAFLLPRYSVNRSRRTCPAITCSSGPVMSPTKALTFSSLLMPIRLRPHTASVETWVAGQPAPDGRRFVGAVVVQNQMHLQFCGYVGFQGRQKLAELLGPMATMALPNDFAGLHVQGSEQRSGPVANIIMAAAFHLSGTHGQQGLGAIQGLDLRLLIHAQHQRPVGWVQIQADDIAHLSMNSGSRDSLKLSLRWGWSAKARQMRLVAVWLTPLLCAMERVLQWVAPAGWCSRVWIITPSTCSSVSLRGAPGRGSSNSPSTPARGQVAGQRVAHGLRDFGVALTPGAGQYDVSPQGQSLRRFASARPTQQHLPLWVGQDQRCCRPSPFHRAHTA